MGSAGDMPQPDAQHDDFESAMGGMALDLASSTGIGEPDVEEKKKNRGAENGQDGVDNE